MRFQDSSSRCGQNTSLPSPICFQKRFRSTVPTSQPGSPPKTSWCVWLTGVVFVNNADPGLSSIPKLSTSCLPGSMACSPRKHNSSGRPSSRRQEAFSATGSSHCLHGQRLHRLTVQMSASQKISDCFYCASSPKHTSGSPHLGLPRGTSENYPAPHLGILLPATSPSAPLQKLGRKAVSP